MAWQSKTNVILTAVSLERIPKELDDAMAKDSSNGHLAPAGISIRHGPVTDEMDVDQPITNGKRKSRGSVGKVVYTETHSSDEDNRPLTKRAKTTNVRAAEVDSDSDAPLSAKRGGTLPPAISDSSDDDHPIASKLAKEKRHIEKEAEKEAKALNAKDRRASVKKTTVKQTKKEADSDDEPLAPAPRKKSNGVKKEESDSDVPLTKRASAAKKTNGKAAPAPKKGAKGKAAVKKEESEEAEDEEEGEFKWWDQPKKEDDSIKWTTLEHNGVVFPPEYEPLPKNVKLRYDGVPVSLHVEAEEVAGFFGAMLNSTHNVENPTFQKNFFGDFKEILDRTGGARDKDGNKVGIKEFSKLDFTQIFEYYQAKSEARKARSSAEKKAEKAAKDAAEAPFLYCKWDGRKERVGNFRVEPPSLFRGRGEHPKTGKVKKRVMPEQITINIGKDATVPAPPQGHKWKNVQHDNKATWLAMWQENINGAYKYVMLAANSTIKGQSDFKKFEKARELKKHIGRIRKDYEKELKSELMADRQRATAMYLIDKFALRAGNEKDSENEAETVGCCSLKFEHITLRPPNTVIFDFLGKDSIRYYDEVTVDLQVFKNLKIFKKSPKSEGDDIFDRLTTSQLNKHLSSYMPGLTAKVFRTYNASYTMSKLLQELKVTNASLAEKIKLYNDCNRKVAILCNHKRTVGAGHEAQMEKLTDRIKGLKYQKWRFKMMMLDLDPKQKKKRGAEFFELDDDLTEEWILEHQKYLVEEAKNKINKKFDKDNEKKVAEKESKMKESERKERLKAADELEKKFKKENKTKKVEAEGKSPSVEKLEASIQKIDDRIKTMMLQAEDREGNKEVALGTSKIVSAAVILQMKTEANQCAELHRSTTHRCFLKEI
jgi:DNA topoisomerase-1